MVNSWVVSALDFHVPLTKTLDLSGEFFNYEIDGTTFLALQHAGLDSNCINLKNPLKVVGFC